MQYSEILKALIKTLGGSGEGLEDEITRLATEFPNMSLLVTDVMRQGAMMAGEIHQLNEKVEILKDCLVSHDLLLKVPAPEGMESMTRDQIDNYVESIIGGVKPEETAEEEIKINDIVWHLAVDEDNPN